MAEKTVWMSGKQVGVFQRNYANVGISEVTKYKISKNLDQ